LRCEQELEAGAQAEARNQSKKMEIEGEAKRRNS